MMRTEIWSSDRRTEKNPTNFTSKNFSTPTRTTMVEFEEIKDEQADDIQETVDEAEWSDTASEISEADAIENETLYDRILALKDIIPAHQRASITRTVSKIYNFGRITTFIGGKAAY